MATNPRTRTVALRVFGLLVLCVFCCVMVDAQITPSADAYTNTASPSTNYGSATTLGVDGATQIAYIQFNLASIPAGASISQATLKLYVNSVTTAGSFNVDYVNGSWTESTITHNLAPALGTTIASGVALTTASKNQYILINITPAVEAWLNGSQTNDGIALVANGSFNATFDSKENTTTSHPAELDIVFAGDGTITGVTTASGSGLTGGGTSGTLNLSLTTACASKQVLQWSGSAWACASVGTGTVTSVASGRGLTGGPITTSGTLSIDTTKVPLLAAANTFTGNQTVSGNLSATGIVTGSGFQIGSNLFDYGSYGIENAFLGFAGNTAMTGGGNTAAGFDALTSNTTGIYNTAAGVNALSGNTAGNYNTAAGNAALGSNTTGGYNTAAGAGALVLNTTGGNNTAAGNAALGSNTTGGNNTAAGAVALVLNTTGGNNTATGYEALFSNTTGNFNTAVGYVALDSNTTGGYNTAAGYNALFGNTTGSYNTASGTGSGFAADNSSITGSNNTFLGSGSAMSTGTLSNATAIGAFAEVSESNALVLGSINGVNGCSPTNTPPCASTNVGIGITAPAHLLHIGTANGGFRVEGPAKGTTNPVLASFGGSGDFAIDAVGVIAGRFVVKDTTGYVGINTAIPDANLTVNGSADKPGGGSWSTLSDRRLKTLDGQYSSGLAEIMKINPVKYRYKDGNGMGIRDREEHVGVVAQEIQQAIPEAVTENSRGYLLVNNDPVIWAMLNAIKEQQGMIERQKETIQTQAAAMKTQQAQIQQLTRQVRAVQAVLKASAAGQKEAHTVKANVVKE